MRVCELLLPPSDLLKCSPEEVLLSQRWPTCLCDKCLLEFNDGPHVCEARVFKAKFFMKIILEYISKIISMESVLIYVESTEKTV